MCIHVAILCVIPLLEFAVCCYLFAICWSLLQQECPLYFGGARTQVFLCNKTTPALAPHGHMYSFDQESMVSC